MDGKRSGRVFLSMVALVMVGILGTVLEASATPTMRNMYDTVHGSPTGTTDCSFCHTSAPDLNATGQTLLDSGFDYCSIGPPTGQCAPAPIIGSFTATPSMIASGQSSTLSWTLSGGAPSSLTIDNGVGSVLGSTSTSVSPAATTTYTLTASNGAGSATRTVTVTVSAVIAPPTIGAFTAVPAMINAGQSSTLSWNLSGGAPTVLTLNNGVGSVLGSSSVVVTPAVTTTYALTVTNDAGTDEQEVTVQVNGVVMAPVITSFTAAPSMIAPGGSSTLSWALSGGAPDTLTIDNGIGSVLGLTSTTVAPAATTTYTLTATNSAGIVTATATVSSTGGALTWGGRVKFEMLVRTLKVDPSGNQKMATRKERFRGSVLLYTEDNGIVKSDEGCYLKFLQNNGTTLGTMTTICIDEIAAVSTEVVGRKWETSKIIGSGSFTSNGPTPVTGMAYIDMQMKAREDSSDTFMSFDLTGKIGGGINAGFVFNGNVNTKLTPVQ